MESEFSSAPTANQVKAGQNPPAASVNTGRFPPSVGDAIAGETERIYSVPQYAPRPINIAYPQDFAPPRDVSSSWPKSLSGLLKGAFLFMVFAALLAATAGAVFFSQEASHERERRYQLENRARGREGGNNANGRAQNAWEQTEDAINLLQAAGEKAAGAGATISIAGEKPIDLGKYAYPGAKVEATVGSFGNEALSLLTHQNFDTVRAFYERQFGKPVIQVVDKSMGDNRNKLIFQSSSPATVLIRIEEFEDNQVKITILHSLLRFPRSDDIQPQSSR